MNRKEARESVMRYVFQMDAQKDFTVESADKFLKDNNFQSQKEYAKAVIHNLCLNQETIDSTINENSKGWPTSRMAKTDLAIIRVAACEILYVDDVPKSVAINEAVELSKVYGGDQSPKFVNAVLKNIG